MAMVSMPRKKTGMEFLPMAGQVIGAAAASEGGPAAMMAGSQVGGQAGGIAKGFIDMGTGDAAKQDALDKQGQSAMQRRMSQIESDPVYQLSESKKALQALPPEIQQQYQKPIDEAYQRAIAQARQNQQMGRTV